MKNRRNTIVTVLVLFTLIFLGYIHSLETRTDTASQSTDDSDTSEDGLPPLEDNLKALYQEAETIYFQIIFGDFDCDTNTSIEKDNYTYYKVTDPNFDSYDSFKTYLLNYFSEGLIDEKLLKPVDTRFIEGEDGTLYMMDFGHSSNILYAGHVFHAAQRSETKITFIGTGYYSNKEEGYVGKPFFTEPKNIRDFTTQDFTFSLVKDDDRWKFDQFSIFY